MIADRVYFEGGGKCVADMRQTLLDAADDVERRGAPGLEDALQDGPAAVAARNVGLRGIAVAHVRDVAHIDHAAVAGRDRDVVQIVDLLGTRVEFYEVLEVADLLYAGGQDQILRCDRIGHVVARQSLCAQGVGVEVDLNLPLQAAVRPGHRGPRDRGKRRAEDVVAQVEDLCLGQIFARHGELQDRNRRGVVG